MQEQAYLSLSLAATLAIAVFGIVMGLLSGSNAIAFDGVYSLANSGMTFLLLFISRLIHQSTSDGHRSRRLTERFNMGLWHLEPIVIAIDGLLLVSIAGYAFLNAAMSLTAGGTAVVLGPAIAYAVVTFVICAGMAVYGRRRNRTLGSDLVSLDNKAWIMSGGITASLLIAFLIGLLLTRAGHAAWLPFIDPLVLSIVSLLIIPVPLREVRQAIREILLVTPTALRARVDAIATTVVARQGFVGYRAYVAEVGRAEQVELYFLLPPGFPARPIEEWDALRDEIGAALGGEERHRWLTVLFTADQAWAE